MRAHKKLDPDEPGKAAGLLVAAGRTLCEFEELARVHDWLLQPPGVPLPAYSPAHRLAATCLYDHAMLHDVRTSARLVLELVASWPECDQIEPEPGLRADATLSCRRRAALHADELLQLLAELRLFARELANFEPRPCRPVECVATTINRAPPSSGRSP